MAPWLSDQLEWVLWYAPWLSDQLEWICGMLHGLVINWSSSAIETSRNRVNGEYRDDKKDDMALPPCDQRYQYLRYEGLQYTDVDIVDFETRLARIYMREVYKVQVFDFGGLPDLMAEGLSARMLMEHKDAQGAESARQIPNKGDLRDYWIGISFARDFLGITPSYTSIRDPILRLCYRLIACSITGRSQAPVKLTVTDLFYLRGMDNEALISRGQFVARLAEHFRLMTKERLRGLTVIAPALPVIYMAELERQPDAAAGAPEAAEDAPVVDEGSQAVSAPVQALQQPPPPPATGRNMPQRFGILEDEIMEAIRETYQVFDGTFWGSSPAAFQRRTRQRTSEASTSTTQQDQQQPDP
ncbi:hypothetical protein Tco_0224091 [Tanacetum coccineum]